MCEGEPKGATQAQGTGPRSEDDLTGRDLRVLFTQTPQMILRQMVHRELEAKKNYFLLHFLPNSSQC